MEDSVPFPGLDFRPFAVWISHPRSPFLRVIGLEMNGGGFTVRPAGHSGWSR